MNALPHQTMPPLPQKSPEDTIQDTWKILQKQFAAEDVPLTMSFEEKEDGRVGEYRYDGNGGKGEVVIFLPTTLRLSRAWTEYNLKQKQSLVQEIIKNKGSGTRTAEETLNILGEQNLLKPEDEGDFRLNMYKDILTHELAHHRHRYEMDTVGHDTMDHNAPDPMHGPHFDKHHRATNPGKRVPFPITPEKLGWSNKVQPPSEFEDFEGQPTKARGRFGPQVQALPKVSKRNEIQLKKRQVLPVT